MLEELPLPLEHIQEVVPLKGDKGTTNLVPRDSLPPLSFVFLLNDKGGREERPWKRGWGTDCKVQGVPALSTIREGTVCSTAWS